MSLPTKPILFNGFNISTEITIKSRVDRVFFTEIYLLSNNKYLYLFTKIKFTDVLESKRENPNLLNVLIGEKSYLGIIQDEYSLEKAPEIPEIITSLTVAKGLDCVAGMHALKAKLISDVINPLANPEKYKKFKVSIPNGILLFGPPGCGKTFIVRKLAEELGYNFIELKHSDVGSPYIHESANIISKTFNLAKSNAPSIIFIDELSGIVPDVKNLGMGSMYKEEEVDEFLMQFNNSADAGVLVVGATNYPDRIDSRILRSGRMDKLIFVPPPDFEARKELFKMSLTGRPYEENIDYEKLAKLTDYYVSSDIELICDEAARLAVEVDIPINEDMIMKVLSRINPSITKDELVYFQQFSSKERS
jgi:transitional endoplasmic reticulum ATPase